MMTPEQKQIKIAECCGWAFSEQFDDALYELKLNGVHVCTHIEPDKITFADVVTQLPVPDYLNSLDAMAQAEKTLSPEELANYEHHISSRYGFTKGLTLPAPQRADAFLITKGVDIS